MGYRRAQSESIGIIFLTFVVVVTVSIGGAVVLDGVADEAGDSGSGGSPLVELTVELTANEITVTHAGGDPIAQSELAVIARGDTTTERYSLDNANVSGDGDGQFEPSERFERDHGLTSSTVNVVVVHTASETVLFQASRDVGEYGG